MAVKTDQKTDRAAIKVMMDALRATLNEEIDPHVQSIITKYVPDDENPDFYRGMFTGVTLLAHFIQQARIEKYMYDPSVYSLLCACMVLHLDLAERVQADKD